MTATTTPDAIAAALADAREQAKLAVVRKWCFPNRTRNAAGRTLDECVQDEKEALDRYARGCELAGRIAEHREQCLKCVDSRFYPPCLRIGTLENEYRIWLAEAEPKEAT